MFQSIIKYFSDVNNGDKVVLRKLNDQITLMEGREEDEDIEDKKVSISFYELAQKGTRMDSILMCKK